MLVAEDRKSMGEYELSVVFDREMTSFYGTAVVRVTAEAKTLCDIGEPLLEVRGKTVRFLKKHLTLWEIHEIREFLCQEHFEVSDLSISTLKKRYCA